MTSKGDHALLHAAADVSIAEVRRIAGGCATDEEPAQSCQTAEVETCHRGFHGMAPRCG